MYIQGLQNKECIFYFKNKVTRVEHDDSNNSTYLIDPYKKELYLFLEGKHALKQTFEEAYQSQSFIYGETNAQITSETKMIAGFKCIQALYTYPVWHKPARTIEIWFTRDILAMNADFDFKGIDGFIMEYSMSDVVIDNNEEVEFRKIMTCSKVEIEKIPDELLKVPPDYVMVTKDQLRGSEIH